MRFSVLDLLLILLLSLLCLECGIAFPAILDESVDSYIVGLVTKQEQQQQQRRNESDPLVIFINAALSQSEAYELLEEFTDTFGHRLTGSKALEDGIDWIYAKMLSDGTFDSVIAEQVVVPHWVRGNEYVKMIEPREAEFDMLGLGMSIGTINGPIRGEVIVVKDYNELDERAAEISGKIVLFNPVWISYGVNSEYRFSGAVRAAQYGAIGALLKSVAPYSLYTPHTGSTDTTTIPYAAITIEDAELVQRFQNRGKKVVIEMYMEAQFLADAISRNIVADYKGTLHPNEVIVIGGHLDSWDVGTGALDDGGGFVVAWESARLMKQLGIRPLRTIRVVGWTNEENGARGADQYFNNRADQMDNHIYAFESDGGVFAATGIGFTGPADAMQIMKSIGLSYLASYGAGNVTAGGGGVDIQPLCTTGVPCSSLTDANSERSDKTDEYFYYHHTKADTMSAIRREEIDLCVATMGTFAYAVADLPERLPRF